jgi:hypothetical protein
MSRPQLVPTCFQAQPNASGGKFVRIGDRIYTTSNPRKYLAAVRRNNPEAVHLHMYECDANGNRVGL